MLVSPVLAIGPTNPPDGKNKNELHQKTATEVTHWNQIIVEGQLPRDGIFKRWVTPEDGRRRTYQRHDARDVNMPNAFDGSDLPFDDYWTESEDGVTLTRDEVGAFELLLYVPTKWVYLDADAYQSLLRANGYDRMVAWYISHLFFPDGAYFKVTYVGR